MFNYLGVSVTIVKGHFYSTSGTNPTRPYPLVYYALITSRTNHYSSNEHLSKRLIFISVHSLLSHEVFFKKLDSLIS